MPTLFKDKEVWIAVFIVAALLLAWYVFNQIEKQVPQGTGKEIQITRQEEVYGISGTVIGLGDNEITIETAVLPSDSISLTDGPWIWNVSIEEDTTIVKFVANEEADEDAPGHEHFVEGLALFNDLEIGARVTLTSDENIKDQFSLADKNMVAAKIEIYSF